jgi:ABC-2 type transport system permease protein
MILFVRRIWAFIVRDLRLQLSYRMQFFLRVISILTIVTTLFLYLERSLPGLPIQGFAQWRDPLAAWLTGLAVLNYFMTGFSSLATAIRQEQVQGTLESVLMTPISVPTVIVASSAWDFLEATLFSSLYLLFGWLFFDVHYRGNFLLALLFLVLTTVVLSCLGILSASFAMVFQARGSLRRVPGARDRLSSRACSSQPSSSINMREQAWRRSRASFRQPMDWMEFEGS